MLKRIFIMLAVALAFTIPSQAISIQELKSSPQFKVMYEVTLMFLMRMSILHAI